MLNKVYTKEQIVQTLHCLLYLPLLNTPLILVPMLEKPKVFLSIGL